MPIGEATQQSFVIPDRAEFQQDPIAVQSPSIDLNVLDGIEDVEGLTEGYYANFAKIRSLQGILAQQGIDITKPDYSNPLSVKANQTFQKAFADLKLQGNKLKNSQALLAQYIADRQRGITRGVSGVEERIGREAFSDLAREGVGVGSRVSQSAQNVIDQIKRTDFNTEGDVQRAEAAKQQALAQLNQRLDAEVSRGNLSSAEELKRDIEAIENVSPIRTQKIFAPRADRSGGRSASALSRSESLIRKVSNVLNNPSGDNFSKLNIVAPSGAFYLGDNTFSGLKYGKYQDPEKNVPRDRVIDKVLVDPSTGEYELQFEHGERERLNRSDVSAFIRGIADSGEYKVSDLEEAARKLNIINRDGSWSPFGLVDPDVNVQESFSNVKDIATTEAQAVGREQKSIDDLINKDVGLFSTSSSQDYELLSPFVVDGSRYSKVSIVNSQPYLGGDAIKVTDSKGNTIKEFKGKDKEQEARVWIQNSGLLKKIVEGRGEQAQSKKADDGKSPKQVESVPKNENSEFYGKSSPAFPNKTIESATESNGQVTVKLSDGSVVRVNATLDQLRESIQ